MSTGQDAVLQALQYAIQMEIDGRALYLQMASASTSEMGKKLLVELASAEDKHRLLFTQIYEKLENRMGWGHAENITDGGKSLRTIFALESVKKPTGLKPLPTELEAVVKAQEMEARSYDYYHNCSEKASSIAERDFFKAIAAEEQEHNLILNDYAEYLRDPGAWFQKTERSSLDG